MAKPLGGGTPTKIRVGKPSHEQVTVNARVGIWGVSSLGVILAEPRVGRFVVFNRDVGCWQVVTSVFHAIRQTWHILFQYGQDMTYGEKGKMARAAQLARTLNLTVLGLEPGRSIRQVRSATRGAVREAALQLGEPRRPSKREALGQLAAIGRGTDSLRRVNPSAMMARTIKTREAALSRLEREILRIDPQIFRRQRALIQLVQYAEQIVLFGVRDFLENVLTDVGMAQLDDPAIRAQVRQHCRYLALDLERLDFVPYRATCAETAEDLRSIADILAESFDDERRREVRDLLVRCRSAMVLKAVQLAIERRLYALMRGGRRLDARRFAEGISETLRDCATVDETGFRHPVGEAASEYLEAAVRECHAGNLLEVKNALKRASDLL
jgi:hypothetical protein